MLPVSRHRTMPSLREAVEATLVGRDERLVARCDVEGILAALDQYCIFDVDDLAINLETAAFGALQAHLGSNAPPSFLALLKARLRELSVSSTPSAAAPSTRAPPSTPSTREPPSHDAEDVTILPLVVTVKFNGQIISERSSLQLPATATWEAAARVRLGEQASEYMSLPLQVHLYPNGQQRESDCVGASISDAVGGGFTLGYSFAVLSFSAPVHGCARPPAKGVNMFPSMMAAARVEGGAGELCLPEQYKCGEGGSLSYELSLFNAIVLQCDRRDLGVRRASRRGWRRSSGPCSSRRASRRRAQRSARGAGSD